MQTSDEFRDEIADLKSRLSFHMREHVKYERQATLTKLGLGVVVIAFIILCFQYLNAKVLVDQYQNKILELVVKQRDMEPIPANQLWHDKRDTIKNWKKVDTSLIDHSEVGDAIQDGFRTH